MDLQIYTSLMIIMHFISVTLVLGLLISYLKLIPPKDKKENETYKMLTLMFTALLVSTSTLLLLDVMAFIGTTDRGDTVSITTVVYDMIDGGVDLLMILVFVYLYRLTNNLEG